MSSMGSIFEGKLVRLAIPDFERDNEIMVGWSRDSEYMRLSGSEPARMWWPAAEKNWLKEYMDEAYLFGIYRCEDDRLIGTLDLEVDNWAVRNAWLGIGIGDRSCWGKGYGSEAMRLLLHYGFEELHLDRVTLNVFEYNTRGVHVYEKLGFKMEGRYPKWLLREGKRWDLIYMGITRSEWEQVCAESGSSF